MRQAASDELDRRGIGGGSGDRLQRLECDVALIKDTMVKREDLQREVNELKLSAAQQAGEFKAYVAEQMGNLKVAIEARSGEGNKALLKWSWGLIGTIVATAGAVVTVLYRLLS